MKIRYMFSSPQGDIEIDEHVLDLPFKLSISKSHNHLKLRDYFDLIYSFVLSFHEANIKRLDIKSEKHGTCYHVASIEFVYEKRKRKKFAVLVGISDSGKYLKREYHLIKMLRRRSIAKKYLPEYYFIKELNLKGENIYLVLSEWLEGYHEWHITEDGDICIWDMDNGYFIASPEQRQNIYERSAHILTCLFDPATFSHIYQWHNCAGDFVLRYYRDKGIDLKLTSVRDYKSVIRPGMNYDISLIISMIYFFLNMTIKMRLDKNNGIGKVLIAPDDVILFVIKGFLSGIDELISTNLLDRGYKEQMIELLCSLSYDELNKLFYSMLDHYKDMDPFELHVILNNIESHVASIHRFLQQKDLL